MPRYCPAEGVPAGCAGFKLDTRPVPGREIIPNDQRAIWSGVNWDPTTLNPYTKPCDHSPCDFLVRGKYAATKIYAADVLSGFDKDCATDPGKYFSCTYNNYSMSVLKKRLKKYLHNLKKSRFLSCR